MDEDKTEMSPKYNSVFWSQRYKKYGDTGYADRIIYKYDQPLRLKIIKKLINKIHGSIKNKKLLDVGCGVGDFSIMFTKMGADVTGIDITKEVIEKAKNRAKQLSCKFLVTSIKDMDFPPQSFDIITSITLLQHIPDDALSSSVQKIADSLKTGGYIYILETVPPLTMQEWIRIFENAGVKLYLETVYPSFGLYLIKVCRNIERIFHRNIVFKNDRKMFAIKNHNILEDSSKLFKIHSIIKKIILSFSKPFDYYMPHFLMRFGMTRIMVFKKANLI